MKKKQLRLLVVILLVGLIAAWWFMRSEPSDKDQILHVITEVETGVEQKAPRRVISYISQDYTDNSYINYHRARLIAFRLLRTTGDIKVDIFNYEEPRIEGTIAYMKLQVRVEASEGNQRYEGPITLTFRKERKGWKVLSSDGWQSWVSEYL